MAGHHPPLTAPLTFPEHRTSIGRDQVRGLACDQLSVQGLDQDLGTARPPCDAPGTAVPVCSVSHHYPTGVINVGIRTGYAQKPLGKLAVE